MYPHQEMLEERNSRLEQHPMHHPPSLESSSFSFHGDFQKGIHNAKIDAGIDYVEGRNQGLKSWKKKRKKPLTCKFDRRYLAEEAHRQSFDHGRIDKPRGVSSQSDALRGEGSNA